MYQQLNLKNQNEQTVQKKAHRYREHFDGCQMGGGLWGWMEKVEGLSRGKYTLVVAEKTWGCKYSIGNIINNILISMRGIRWV